MKRFSQDKDHKREEDSQEICKSEYGDSNLKHEDGNCPSNTDITEEYSMKNESQDNIIQYNVGSVSNSFVQNFDEEPSNREELINYSNDDSQKQDFKESVRYMIMEVASRHINAELAKYQPSTSKCNQQVLLNSEEYTNIETKVKNSILLDGTYFQVTRICDREYIEATCQLCLPLKKVIRGLADSTSIFAKHLRRAHPRNYEEYEKYRQEKRDKRKKVRETEDEQNIKRLRPNYATVENTPETTISQNTFDIRLISFLANTMSPVRIIENQHFINLFEGTNLNILNMSEAIDRITQMHENHMKILKSKLQQLDSVCLTADYWCDKFNQFFGVTVHWIDTNFKRSSEILSCKRYNINGTLNYYELLEDIKLKFDIPENKIASISLNNKLQTYKLNSQKNGFIEAQTGIQFESINRSYDHYNTGSNIELYSNIFKRIHNFLMQTLNCDKKDPTDLFCHVQIFSKLEKLFQKSLDLQTSELINKILGYYLNYELNIWLDYFNIFKRIINEKYKYRILFDELRIMPLKEIEIKYLEEYIVIMQPFATMLDVLTDKETYYGYLLPCLVTVKNKLDKLKVKEFKYGGKKMLNFCLWNFTQSFSDIFSLKCTHTIISSVLCPNFKLCWYNIIKNTSTTEETIKHIIISKAVSLETQNLRANNDLKPGSESFFDFNQTQEASQNKNDEKEITCNIELQLLKYLDDTRTNINMLNDYPILKKMFLKYNCLLTSTTAVEDLFSYNTIVNAPKEDEMNNDLFEKLIILKAAKIDS